jgi:dUTP pyrophosphatase
MSASSSSSNIPRLFVKRLKDNAIIPVRQSPLAAGYDLSSTENTTVPSGGTVLVKTGHSIDVGAGVIDADYRGEVGVILFNFGKKDFEIKEGDRIAQLVLEKIALAEVEEVQDLDETLRGSGGFGSTGVSEPKRQRTITPNPEEGKKE